MHISLFLLGVLSATAGFIAIGFGVPINAFSLGNTLIMAGTTAVVGGFILIGLAAAVRQLRRIAQALAFNTAPVPFPVHPAPSFAPLAPSSMQGNSGSALPPSNSAYNGREQPPSEQQSSATHSVEPEPLEWLRPKYKVSSLDEPSEDAEPEIPLPPPSRRPTFPLPPKAFAPLQEPKVWLPSRPVEATDKVDQEFRLDSTTRAAPAEGHPAQNERFNKVWLEERSAQGSEIIERASKPDTAGYARDESQADKGIASEPQPSAILKSGVIDGMAYTLYTDGSIEAVLAAGTIRFASVDELRIHLEKHS
jgi:hypothetical protein